MNLEIYCFSGTGNSLYVAKELTIGFPNAKLYPIVGLLRKTEVATHADTVGLVFPIYCHTIPLPVKEFVKKLELKSATYVFAVATTDATQCRAFIDIDRILKKRGRYLDSYFVLEMANNMPFYVRYPEFTAQKKLEQMNSAVKKAIPKIRQIIFEKKQHRLDDTYFLRLFPAGILPFMPALIPLNRFIVRKMTVFYADDKCDGCGTCEKVCLSEKIEIANQKPMWKANVRCFQCQACINYCSKHSIQQNSTWFMKSYSASNGRHHDPSVSANDIAAQKFPNPLSLVSSQ